MIANTANCEKCPSRNEFYGEFGKTRGEFTRYHFGTDFAGTEGDEVRAMYNGAVWRVYKSPDLGWTVMLQTLSISGQKYYVEYGHLQEKGLIPETPRYVKAGEVTATGIPGDRRSWKEDPIGSS